jgi:hypothetical protein
LKRRVYSALCDMCTINSATGTRTRVARVRAEYPNQLDYSGACSLVAEYGALGQ